MPIQQSVIRQLGKTRMSTVTMWAVAGGSQYWPEGGLDTLDEDRMYRMIMGRQLVYEAASLDDQNFFIYLTGPNIGSGSNDVPIWSRYFDTSHNTTDPSFLQGNEMKATLNRYTDPLVQLPEQPFPPGTGLILGSQAAATAGIIELRMVVAESPDPRELYPFINARTGGLSGLDG